MQPVDQVIAAVLAGDEVRVAELVRADRSLASARNMFGVSPVHVAHFTGQDEVVDALFRLQTLDLALAAELGRVDVVRDELRARPEGAREFDEAGSTALHRACYWGQVSVAQLLLDAGADATVATRDTFLQIAPLGSAVATTPGVQQPSDDEDVVLTLTRLLLEHGADRNHQRIDGMTALHTAAWRGLGRVVQVLLDAGADPSVAATSGAHAGETPADSAVSQGHYVLAATLDVGSEAVS